MSEELQFKVFRFLEQNRNIKQKDIAMFCNLSASGFNYYLLHGMWVDEQTEKLVVKFLENHGVFMGTPADECEIIKDEILEFAGVIAYELGILTKLTKKQLKDKKLTLEEREHAVGRLIAMRRNINQEIDNLIITVKG